MDGRMNELEGKETLPKVGARSKRSKSNHNSDVKRQRF